MRHARLGLPAGPADPRERRNVLIWAPEAAVAARAALRGRAEPAGLRRTTAFSRRLQHRRSQGDYDLAINADCEPADMRRSLDAARRGWAHDAAITLDGAVGVGKSTLLSQYPAHPSLTILREPVGEWADELRAAEAGGDGAAYALQKRVILSYGRPTPGAAAGPTARPPRTTRSPSPKPPGPRGTPTRRGSSHPQAPRRRRRVFSLVF